MDLPLESYIEAIDGQPIKILSKLGEGGQGMVYRVEYLGNEFALKWYFINKMRDPDAFYDNLARNIENGSPTKNFLWPEVLTKVINDSFGYLMPLRPKEYVDFTKILLAKVKFSSIITMIDAAITIVQCFNELHAKGSSYQDLNDGNFFVNPQTGDVLICDNDNVAPYGITLGIAGKCRYMAPEIVVGKKMPDVHTDRFSLAVVLYMLFFLNHPLEGKKAICPCLTEEWERKIYGEEPLFVFDKIDKSNRPIKDLHTNELKLWAYFPKSIRELFCKAFSQELMIGKDIEHRITEREWLKELVNLRGMLIKCSHGDEFFYDGDEMCPFCQSNVSKPLILTNSKMRIVLDKGQFVYDIHINSGDALKIAGEVIGSKSNPGLLGLRNLSNIAWEAILPNGVSKIFKKNEVIKLGRGLKIIFSPEKKFLVE